MILVTGATGTIGRELVQSLLSHGVEFKGMVRGEDACAFMQSHGIGAVLGDFSRPETFPSALAGATLTSPIAGTVTVVNLSVGQQLSASGSSSISSGSAGSSTGSGSGSGSRARGISRFTGGWRSCSLRGFLVGCSSS